MVKLVASGGDGPEFESQSSRGIFKNSVELQALANVSVTGVNYFWRIKKPGKWAIYYKVLITILSMELLL